MKSFTFCQLFLDLLLLVSVVYQAVADETKTAPVLGHNITRHRNGDTNTHSNTSLILPTKHPSTAATPSSTAQADSSSNSQNTNSSPDNSSTSVDKNSSASDQTHKKTVTPTTSYVGSVCAYYDNHPSAKKGNIELFQQYRKSGGDVAGGGRMGEVRPDNVSVLCSDFCFTLWLSDPHNKSRVTVSKQGCWIISGAMECQPGECVSRTSPRQNHTHFCCCRGNMCNREFKDLYNPADHTTSTTESTPIVDGPLQDHSYRDKTIVIAMVSVLSVSLVVVCTYLAYRLCLTVKTPSPQTSVVRVEPDTDSVALKYNLDNLKMEEVLVRGRYSEVRRGMLGQEAVAIKIYQPHNRQYYYNERNAYNQPFMEHENIVKFFGAKELEDPNTGLPQYIIVTSYIPLGALTSYLKHNTIDWYTLCHMCQGISRGMAHLHTDIQRGGLFKLAIAHRDLNTRNILVMSDLTCVIADLGFAVGMQGSKIIKNGIVENAEQASVADVGTLRYMAPEVFVGAVNLRDCEASLKQIDIYSLGLVIWEVSQRCVDLYQGTPVPEYQLPFQAECGSQPTFEEMQTLVVKYKTRPKFPQVWKDSNPAVRSLKETVEDCWDTDAEARLTALCVQERITDMAALWVQGSKHRGVTPTLNATMNLPEGGSTQGGMMTSGGIVVSNGVTYLPLYVDDRKEETSSEKVVASGEDQTVGVRELSHMSQDKNSVTAPLISNVAQLNTSPSLDIAEGRVRSWVEEQSVSESTMDTLLPPTPSAERADITPDSVHVKPAAPAYTSTNTQPVKANNVVLAKKKAVILHPNQGRNPTVERNTHKRSDEELTVSGNQLVGPSDQMNRRGSIGTQSAPPNQHGGSSFDGGDAVESSSLVQNDALNQQQQQHPVSRNPPIPYLQNQVYSEARGMEGGSLTRPKLANLSGNRNSYLRLQGEDGSPHDEPGTAEVAGTDGQSTSLKHKLSKLIRPRELGVKISHLFGGRSKKKHNSYTLANCSDVEVGQPGNQYINSGLEASPVNRNTAYGTPAAAVPVSMEVQMVNGTVMTRTRSDALATHNTPLTQLHQTGNMTGAGNRLSATNVMRLAALSNQHGLPSPSLFPGKTEVNSNGTHLTDSLDPDTAVPLQNLVTSRSAKDYGSMRPVMVNQAYEGTQMESSGRSLDNPDFSSPPTGPEVADSYRGNCLSGSEDSPKFVKANSPYSLRSATNIDSGLTFDNLSDNQSHHPSNLTCDSVDNPSRKHTNQPKSNMAATSGAMYKLKQPPSHSHSKSLLQKTRNTLTSMSSGTLDPNLSSSTPTGSSRQIQAVGSVAGPQAASSSTVHPTTSQCAIVDRSLPDSKGGHSIMYSVPSEETSWGKHAPYNTKVSQPGQLGKSRPLSQSQSVTDLGRHEYNKMAAHAMHDLDLDDRVRDERHLWRDGDMSQSLNLASQPRPKSLSLKGHNYTHSKVHLKPAQVMASSTSTHLAARDENGPLGLVVPNVTLSKNQAHAHGRNGISQKSSNPIAAQLPTVAVAKAGISNTSGSFGINTSSGNSNNNTNTKTMDLAVSNGRPSLDSADDTEVVTAMDNVVDMNVNNNTTTSKNVSASNKLDGADKTNSSIKRESHHPALDRSNSSEKIRRRIKTPVSFKKGRLSLYDDRLMSHSFQPVHPAQHSEDQSSSVQQPLHSTQLHIMMTSDSDLVM